jgi:hypothetical protein
LAALEAEEQAGLKRDLVLKTVAAARRRVQGMGKDCAVRAALPPAPAYPLVGKG